MVVGPLNILNEGFFNFFMLMLSLFKVFFVNICTEANMTEKSLSSAIFFKKVYNKVDSHKIYSKLISTI